jgi:sulfite reductase (NADPH) flavoprotein alpha-component
MVCGGTGMAQGVMETIDEIVSPLGFNVASLKSAGRYLEDVY